MSSVYHPLVTVELTVGKSTVTASIPPSPPPQPPNEAESNATYISVGVSGAVVALIAAAVIVMSVTVCLRKRNNKHVNITDNVAYGVSRNEIELSACDDVANQPSSEQLIMIANEAYAGTQASDSNYINDNHMDNYATEPTTAILTPNAAYNAQIELQNDAGYV